jgi:hypothetical protein
MCWNSGCTKHPASIVRRLFAAFAIALGQLMTLAIDIVDTELACLE